MNALEVAQMGSGCGDGALPIGFGARATTAGLHGPFLAKDVAAGGRLCSPFVLIF
jgi:hypothetical protein